MSPRLGRLGKDSVQPVCSRRADQRLLEKKTDQTHGYVVLKRDIILNVAGKIFSFILSLLEKLHGIGALVTPRQTEACVLCRFCSGHGILE